MMSKSVKSSVRSNIKRSLKNSSSTRNSIRKLFIWTVCLAVFITQLMIFPSTVSAVTELSSTVSPVACSTSDLPERITVTASSGTPFTAGGATPYLRQGDTDYGSITNITSSTTEVSFTVSGLNNGEYTVRIVDPKGVYNAGTFVVGSPSITAASPSSIANGYSQNVSVTLTGQNTNFIYGQSTVKILDGNTDTGKAGSVTSVANSEQLTFTLNTGLAAGTYKVKVTTVNIGADERTETAEGVGLLTVRGVPSLSLSSSSLNEGYSSTTLTVTGTNTAFDDSTTVTILNGSESTGKAGTPTITDADTLSFTVNTGLTAGTYTVKATTGEEVATATLTVGSASGEVRNQGSSFSGASQGYTTSYSLTFNGTNTSFDSGTSQLKLYNGDPNGSGQDITSANISGTSVSSTTAVAFTLGTGLDAGTYYVRVVTGSQTVTDTFVINPISLSAVSFNSSIVEDGTVIVPEGYKSTTANTSIQVQVTGTNTLFQTDTTVKIKLGAVEQSGKTSSKSIASATSMSFNLVSGLSSGSYTIEIDMDGSAASTDDILTSNFTVTAPSIVSISPSTVITGSSPVQITVIGQDTHFTSGTPSIDFTGASGETISNIIAVVLSDEDDTEQLTFSVIPASNLFTTNGAYTFTIRTNNDYIDESLDANDGSMINVSNAGISISPSTVYSNELGSKSMTITGTNTSFDTTAPIDTKVYIDAVEVSASIVSTTSITFTVPASLASGSRTLTIDEDVSEADGVEYSTTFQVTPRNIAISSTSKPNGYDQFNMTITAVGVEFNTTTKKPDVSVIGSDGTTSITLLDGNIATSTVTFAFPAGKATGIYSIKTSWSSGDNNGINLTTPFYVTPAAPSASPGSGSYNAAQSVTLTPASGAANTYYTLDGNDPNASSILYSSAFSVNAEHGQTKTLKAVSYDAAGNKGTVLTAAYVFDKVAPGAPTVTGSTPTNDTTPAWSWTSGGNGGNGTYRYKLDSSDLTTGATETATAGYTPGSALEAGSHTLYVQERDTAGNWSTSGSYAIVIDITAPSAPVVTGSSPTNDTTPVWNWTSGGGGNGTYRYKLDSSDLTTGATETATVAYTPGSTLETGSHTLYVQERDDAGNWSTSGSFAIVIDVTAPGALVVTGSTPTNDTTPAWSWTSSGEGNGTYRYKLDSSDLTTGATQTSDTGYTQGSALEAGSHTLYVQESDEADNWSESSSFTIVIDVTAPDAPGVTGSTPTNDTTPAWSWTSGVNGGNGTYRYKLDSSDLSTGATQTTNTGYTPGSLLAAGSHTLYVQERDNAGNWSTSGSFEILIDVTAPGAPVVIGSTPTNDTTPAWSWTSGGDGNGTYRYKLDSSDLSTGTTQTTNTGYTPGSALEAGSHTLYVQERDTAGNWSTSGSFEIVIDVTAPGAPVVTGSTPTNDTTPAWSWTSGGNGGNGTYRYKLDSSDLTTGATETTTVGYTPESALGAGNHTLYVQERDSTGNWSESGSFAILIDVTAPSAPVVTGSTPTNDTTPAWSWTSGGNGGNGTYRYKLDSSDLTTGATETTTAGYTPESALGAGNHTLYVQERDDAGNWSASGSLVIEITVVTPPTTTGGGGVTPSDDTDTEEPPEDTDTTIEEGPKGEIIINNEALETTVDDENDVTTTQLTGAVIEQSLINAAWENNGEMVIELPEVETGTQMLMLDEDAVNAISSNDIGLSVEVSGAAIQLPGSLFKDNAGSSLEVAIENIRGDRKDQLLASLPDESMDNLSAAGSVMEITITARTGAEENQVTTFVEKLVIRISIIDVDRENVDTRKLGIYYLDEVNQKWVYVGGEINEDTWEILTETGHLTKFAVMEYNKTFTDVEAGRWFRDYVDIVAARHIITGVSENNFAPYNQLTRAEFAAMIVRALNLQQGTYTGQFSDVGPDDWFTPYIEAAVKAGIVNGIGNGKYNPNGKITREEMAKIIMYAYKYQEEKTIASVAAGVQLDFTDKDSISGWAADSVKAAFKLGIINGMGNGTFAPKSNAIRAEAAKIIYKFLEAIGKL